MTSQDRHSAGYYSYDHERVNSMVIDPLSNRLTSYTLRTGPTSPVSYTPAYDANGNMTGNRFSSATYDWRNLMSQVTKGGTTVDIGYDAGGNRVMKDETSGTQTHYVRGAAGQTIGVFEDGSQAFVNLIGPSGEVIGSYDGTERRYFVKDHLGSIRTTVDEHGNVDGYDDYYPFGLTMTGRSSNSSNPNDAYKFTGHERDDEAGLDLDYMMARTYDPVIGRFLQIDPMHIERRGLSPYNYVQNNPLNRIDPTGLLDEYALNRETGKVTLIQKTDDDFDVLYATDTEGNVDENTSVTVSKNESGGSILSDLAEGNNVVETEYNEVTYQGVVANTTNGGDASRVFGFAARNSNVEWSYQAFADGTFSVSTAFNSNITTTGSLHSSNFGKIVAHDVHNHPVSIPRDRYPSGGDALRAAALSMKNPSVKVWLYVPQNLGSNRLWNIRTMKRIN